MQTLLEEKEFQLWEKEGLLEYQVRVLYGDGSHSKRTRTLPQPQTKLQIQTFTLILALILALALALALTLALTLALLLLNPFSLRKRIFKRIRTRRRRGL